jgi:hypothetical protein
MQDYPNNSYPSEEDLTTIENWDSFNDPMGLINFIEPMFEEYGVVRVTANIEEQGLDVYMATGGWSGNESIIEALQNNYMFWSLYWQESKRGGGYLFTINNERIKNEQVR